MNYAIAMIVFALLEIVSVVYYIFTRIGVEMDWSNMPIEQFILASARMSFAYLVLMMGAGKLAMI